MSDIPYNLWLAGYDTKIAYCLLCCRSGKELKRKQEHDSTTASSESSKLKHFITGSPGHDDLNDSFDEQFGLKTSGSIHTA